LPNIEDIVYRLECIYRMANKTASLDAVAWAKMNFDVSIIAAQWSAVLDTMMNEKRELVLSHREEFV
jgi:hypothetical protein